MNLDTISGYCLLLHFWTPDLPLRLPPLLPTSRCSCVLSEPFLNIISR